MVCSQVCHSSLLSWHKRHHRTDILWAPHICWPYNQLSVQATMFLLWISIYPQYYLRWVFRMQGAMKPWHIWVVTCCPVTPVRETLLPCPLILTKRILLNAWEDCENIDVESYPAVLVRPSITIMVTLISLLAFLFTGFVVILATFPIFLSTNLITGLAFFRHQTSIGSVSTVACQCVCCKYLHWLTVGI